MKMSTSLDHKIFTIYLYDFKLDSKILQASDLYIFRDLQTDWSGFFLRKTNLGFQRKNLWCMVLFESILLVACRFIGTRMRNCILEFQEMSLSNSKENECTEFPSHVLNSLTLKQGNFRNKEMFCERNVKYCLLE